MNRPHDPPSDTLEEIEERLETILEAALSSRRTVTGIVQIWAQRTPEQRRLLLHWLPILAGLNPELGFQCARIVPAWLDGLDHEALTRRLQEVMDRYDQSGLQAALEALRGGGGAVRNDAGSVRLTEVMGVLTHFVTALGGRRLGIVEGAIPLTTTETLILPPSLSLRGDPHASVKLYDCLTAHLWALGRFGTFFMELPERLSIHPDPEEASRCYLTLEAYRVDGILARRLPGLGRFMAPWLDPDRFDPPWNTHLAALMAEEGSVEESLNRLAAVYGSPLPEPPPFHGALDFKPALSTLQQRLEREKRLFRKILGTTLAQMKPIQMAVDPRESTLEAATLDDGMTLELRLDGQPLILPDDLQTVTRSIIQDLGQLPPEYLQAAGPGGYLADATGNGAAEADAPLTSHADLPEDGFLYPEWDHQRQGYRRDWCRLRERTLDRSDDPVVARTLEKHRGLWQQLRRKLEWLRGGDRWLRRQEQGDEVDMDVWLDSWMEERMGQESDPRLFRQRRHDERNIATLILVDMSGSTKGWVNEAIRESLVLLCKALEVLQDRFAVYGFSSMTRKHCDCYVIKRFDQSLNPEVEGRIAAIAPKDYTRMGVFLRHATHLLNQQPARIRLLITISDGKPEDYDSFQDGYRGIYGLKDTRQALIEAKHLGIHPFCITIDREAGDYLPQLYGPARYVVLDDVRLLPLKITDIYRRLTS
ncbi:MAG: hypothetical protein HQM01_09100 [Magnetococcales bacterium]|nr:hypothetical protein [Magnetococcales bacterium]